MTATHDDLARTATGRAAGRAREREPEAAAEADAGRRDAPIRVAVVGATGYAGAEAVRILARHPNVHIAGLVGRGREDEPIGADPPAPGRDRTSSTPSCPTPTSSSWRFPMAPRPRWSRNRRGRPHDHRPRARLPAARPGRLSALVPLRPPAPGPARGRVYGLPELHRAELAALADAAFRIVGAPGCYPTATLLALAPLARAGLIGDLVVDAKSGVSGAGREAKPELLFAEVNESVKAYGLGGHRHVAEMQQELAG